ncbi:MAG: ACP S-malonyltransferase [Treponema sp.]|jgi:[acyl-carrier-protein] S-malonyltransferase|nr:ACP S-malonyltransferase [Treponema sp.]
MKAFFLFPGQGAQYTDMALDLLEEGGKEVKRLFEIASEICGQDMKILLKSDAETLKRTDISQPAITLANLAAAAFLGENGITASGCAGFSLGEYAALALSGVIGTEDCFRLVSERGKAMQAAADKIREKAPDGEAPGMAAIINLAPEKVEELINQLKKEGKAADLYAANFNSSRQTVVSGTARALAEAHAYFKEAGAKRVLPLAVAGPFHSPLMEEAARAFEKILEKTNFNRPALPFFSNVSGKLVLSGEEAKELALAHITSPVRWTEEEKNIANLASKEGFDLCLEVGPGKVLQGFWQDTGSALPCLAAGTAPDIKTLEAEKRK